MSDELFQKSRANKKSWYGEYPTVILRFLMMTAGANIAEEHLFYLRMVAARTETHAGFHLPISDKGFRDPGKVQFLTAIEFYKNGKPRDFRGPGCFPP
jgi:hypothetical protein